MPAHRRKAFIVGGVWEVGVASMLEEWEAC